MRISLGLAVVLALAAVLAFGLTGTSAAPAVVPSENAVVDSSGVAADRHEGRGALNDAVTEDKRLHALVGSSAFTHLAE